MADTMETLDWDPLDPVVDADPYGGTVSQQLGIMDEVSGLLSAARLATTGALEARFATALLDAWGAAA